MTPKTQSLIDEIIRDAMASGEFSNLPGEGKPLELEDEAHVPQHLRLAHKLLRDNDLVPDWIMQGLEIDALRPRLLANLRRAARRYLRSYDDPARVEAEWQAARAAFEEEAARLNRKVLSYNLKVPTGVAHKSHLDAPLEIRRALEQV